jgi:hypothetical protein
MGQTAVYVAFREIISHRRRNSMQDAGNGMLVIMSSGAGRKTARTAATLDLDTIAQRSLAARASRLADSLMMIAAGTGRFLLGVAGATVPNAFPERHAGSFRRARAIFASAAARHVPVCAACSAEPLCGEDVARREVRCRILPRPALAART